MFVRTDDCVPVSVGGAGACSGVWIGVKKFSRLHSCTDSVCVRDTSCCDEAVAFTAAEALANPVHRVHGYSTHGVPLQSVPNLCSVVIVLCVGISRRISYLIS